MVLAAGQVGPYASFEVIRKILENTRNGEIQDTITKDDLDRIGIHPGHYSRTLKTLRLFDFTIPSGTKDYDLISPSFNGLNALPDNEHLPRLAQLLEQIYQPVITQVDLNNCTIPEVQKAFEIFFPQGQRHRMMSLFLSLLNYTNQYPRLPVLTPGRHAKDKTPARFEKTIAIAGGHLTISTDMNIMALTGNERKVFFQLLDIINNYEKERE